MPRRQRPQRRPASCPLAPALPQRFLCAPRGRGGMAGEAQCLSYAGCNFLRQRLVLATLSGRPLKIRKIRAKEEDPGLRGERRHRQPLREEVGGKRGGGVPAVPGAVPGARCRAGTAPHREPRTGQPRAGPGWSEQGGAGACRCLPEEALSWEAGDLADAGGGAGGAGRVSPGRLVLVEANVPCKDVLAAVRDSARSAEVSLLLPGLPCAGPKRRAPGLVPLSRRARAAPLSRRARAAPARGPAGGWDPLAARAAPQLAPGTLRSSRRSCGIWRLSGCRRLLCAQCAVLRLFAGAEVPRFYCVWGCALIFAWVLPKQ